MPGGMGVNLVRQYSQAGLKDRIPFLSAFTADEGTLPAQQDAAIGLFGALTWAPNMDNQPSKKFVAAYEPLIILFRHLTRCRPTTPPC
jgi:branched-chain amino acid transport system substrate-binding protein